MVDFGKKNREDNLKHYQEKKERKCEIRKDKEKEQKELSRGGKRE